MRSEPKDNPKIILNIPKTEIKEIPIKDDFRYLKGNESTIVIIAIATTVPTAKKIKKIIPEKKFGVLGKIAIKTAALPARP